MWEKIKRMGSIVLVLGCCALLVLLIGLYIHGTVWLGAKSYSWLRDISIAISVLILLPLSFIRCTRIFAAHGLWLMYYVYFLLLWLLGLLLTYNSWGAWGVFFSLLLFGIGPIPVAMITTLINGMWLDFADLIIMLILAFSTQAYSINVGRKAAQEQ